MNQTSDRPYFLWDYDLTNDQVHQILHGPNPTNKAWLMGRILTSARFEDVWNFLTVDDIVSNFSHLKIRPGIKKNWQNALNVWGYHV